MNNIDEQILEKMAIEEEVVRKSDYYINECNKVKDVINGWIELTDRCQREIVEKYFKDEIEMEFAIKQLRIAHKLYPNNQIFKDRLQVKYNRARKGDLCIDDIVHPCINDYIKEGVNVFVGSSMT